MRALQLLVAGIALFCLGISLSFVASAAATTTEVCCAPGGKALGDADGEALVRLDEDPSGPLTPAAEEVRDKEEALLRSSLMSMLVLAASSFFSTSGLVLVARNSSLKGGVSHSLGLLGGSWAAGCGGVPFLGVYLL